MLENVGRVVENAHVGLQKSCLEALRTSTWSCLPHRAAQRSPRARQEAQTPPLQALWTCKTRTFKASRLPKQRFGCLFKRKEQPNQRFTKVALVKALVLRLQIAPGCSLFLLFAPRSSLSRSSSLLPCLGSPRSSYGSSFCVVFVLSLVLGVLLFLLRPGFAKASPQDAGNGSDDTLEFPRDFR